MAKDQLCFPGKFHIQNMDIMVKIFLMVMYTNIPLLNLRNKVIVMVQDPINNLKNTPLRIC